MELSSFTTRMLQNRATLVLLRFETLYRDFSIGHASSGRIWVGSKDHQHGTRSSEKGQFACGLPTTKRAM